MMKIKLLPDLIDGPLEASVDGDILTINGEAFDFSFIPDGHRFPGKATESFWFDDNSYIERIGKTLHMTLRLPVHWDSPEEFRNPAEPLILDVVQGAVSLPDTSPPEPEELSPIPEPEDLVIELEADNG